MSPEDAEYYRQRAESERALAESASRIEVRIIHLELARQYETLVEQPELRPKMRIVC